MEMEDNLTVRPEIAIDSSTPLQQPIRDLYQEKRQEFIQLLRQLPSLVQLAKTLTEGKTYQAYITPEVLERLRDNTARFGTRDSGLLSASILDSETGKIIHNASLMEVHPDLLNSLNQLAVQQTLANIVQRLELIDEKVTDILQGQQNDRLADVQSGVDIYEQAIAATGPETRLGLLISAIQKLNDGRNKLLKSTDIHFVDKLPRNRLSMLFSPNLDIPKFVQSKAEPVWKAAHAIVRASRYLVLAYTILDEPVSLRVSLQQSEKEILTFEEKVKQIIHWLPPDDRWRESMLQISEGIMPTNRQLEVLHDKAVTIEFLPEEIAPPEGEYDHKNL
ncbi:MAG: hypothetical protein KJ077_34405 [Anaerolineae bacterium]|nr:hypothetical protein [Anaerolineae bacterium]